MTMHNRPRATRAQFGRFATVFALLAAFGLAVLHAQVLSQGTSNAYGEFVALTFTGPGVSGSATSGPLPTVSGTAPPAYSLTNSLASAAVTATAPAVGTVLTTGVLTVNAASSVPIASTTTADATVNNVNQNLAVSGLTAFGLNATTVRSTAAIGGACGALTGTGTTTIENGTVTGSLLGASAGAALTASPAPNTIVGAGAALGTALAAAGISITLNEQIVTGDASNRRIVVNAIHIRYTNTNLGGAITTNGEVVIGHSEASVTCAATTGGAADLAVTLTDNPDPVLQGNALTYTATVTNNGPTTATSVVLNETLPAGATFVQANASQGTCTQAGGLVTCNLGNLASGAAATVNITVTPTLAGTITSTATAGSSSPDPNSANNSATQSTTVTSLLPPADVALTITDAPDPVAAGSVLTYTITATNNGPNNATGVVISDTLPAGVTFVSATSPQGTCSFAGGVVTCPVGDLTPGAAATVQLSVRPTAAGTVTNTATVGTTSPDPSAANNSGTASTTVTAAPLPTDANIGVTVVTSPGTVAVGGDLTLTAMINNAGPAAAAGTVLTFPLPAGAAFVSATASQGSCALTGTTVTCNIGTVAVGATPTVTIVVRPGSAGSLAGVFGVASTTNDPSLSNNTAIATVTIVAPVPTMTEWALMALATVLLAIGYWMVRRRNTLNVA